MTLIIMTWVSLMLKMVAFDMDGTILNVPSSLQVIHDGKEVAAALYVPGALIQRLELLCQRGIKIGINSARSFERVMEPLRANDIFPHKEFPHFVIANQREIYVRDGAGFIPVLEWNNQFGRNGDAEIRRHVRGWVDEFQQEYECLADGSAIVCSTESSARRLADELSEIMAGEGLPFDIYRVQCQIFVIERNGCKGAALLRTAELFKLKADEVLAVGDSENDITMLDGRHGLRSATPSNAPFYIKEMVSANKGYVASASHGDGSAEIVGKLFSLPATSAQPVGEEGAMACLEGEIRNEASGEKMAARVIIRDSTGKYANCPYITCDDKLYHREFSGHKAWYDGSFRASVKPGVVALEASCGLEYTPVSEKLTLRAGETRKMAIVLKRASDMAGRGWHCGDLHAHPIHGNREVDFDISRAARAARAEGMDFVALTGDSSRRWDSGLKACSAAEVSGECERLSDGKFVCLWDQEVKFGRSFSHYLRLGAKDLLWSDEPMYAVADGTHTQNGIIVSTHPCVPQEGFCAKDLWLNLQIGAVDAFDIMTGGSSPWLGDGLWHDPFPVSLGLWFRLLNKGYRLPAVGCSDTLFDCYTGGEHFGVVRTYVMAERLDAAGILEGIRKGRTFVTTGPLVVFSIDGKLPGDELSADGSKRKVKIDVSLINVGDWKCAGNNISKVELIRNGETVGAVSPDKSAASLDWEIEEEGNCWYAARCFGPCQDIVAVTSPIYFLGRNPAMPVKVHSVSVHGWLEDAITGKRLQGVVEVWQGGVLRESVAVASGEFRCAVPPLARLRVTATGYQPKECSPLDDERLRKYINGLDVWKFADDSVADKIAGMLSEVQTIPCKLVASRGAN